MMDTIRYHGDRDVAFQSGYLSVTLSKEWFFCEAFDCYGIPICFACTDTTGDVFFDVRLRDEKNDLSVGLSLNFCQRYHAVFWLERGAKNRVVTLHTFVNFCGKRFSQDIAVDFGEADFGEAVDVEQNDSRARSCYCELEFDELWNLRKDNAYLGEIDLDAVLQNRLRPMGYVVSDNFGDYDSIYYVWSGEDDSQTDGEAQGDEPNGLKISAALLLDDVGAQLRLLAADKEHPNSEANRTVCMTYNYFMDDIAWENDLTNVIVRFESDEIDDVLEKGYLELSAGYRGRAMLLRIIFRRDD